MIYSARINAIKNNEYIGNFYIYDFVGGNPPIKLDDLVEYAKSKIESEFDNVFVDNVKPAYEGIAETHKDKEIPKELQSIYSISKQEWEKYYASMEYKKSILCNDMKRTLQHLAEIRKKAEEIEILDSQEFLDYQDELNKLSLDPDRDEKKETQ